MTDHSIKPEKITTPIQLLAAWLVGLLAIDSCFLFAAAHLDQSSWQAGALTIAAILNVPLFLAAVFLLQTKFRPELQEDSYYSTYLSRKTNEPIKVGHTQAELLELRQEVVALQSKLVEPTQSSTENQAPFVDLTIGVSRHLKDREVIKKKLAECGVLGTTIFGADEPPDDRVVAISPHIPKKTFKELVKVASALGFSGYSYLDKRGEDVQEDVLFGAYGGKEFELTN